MYRTPPDVKVGREPFDEAVRRALEAQYPDVGFDWRKILETPIPSADAERWRERRRADRAARQAASVEAAADEADSVESAEDLDLPTPLQPTGGEPVESPETENGAVSPASTSTSPAPVTVPPTRDVASKRRRRRRGRRGRPEGGVTASAVSSQSASAGPGVPPDTHHAAVTEHSDDNETADVSTESTGE